MVNISTLIGKSFQHSLVVQQLDKVRFLHKISHNVYYVNTDTKYIYVSYVHLVDV